LINAGYDIATFAKYVEARQAHYGRIASLRALEQKIALRFGSYADFLQEVAISNHRVLRVVSLDEQDVYDVEVDCPTADDKSSSSGHNFVIWPGTQLTGSGIVVFNTRRAAKMDALDLDHPDIEEFINWKVVEEAKVAALVTGSRLLNKHLNNVLKACHGWSIPEERLLPAKNADLRKAIADARAAMVPVNSIERVLQLAEQGYTSLRIEEYDTDWDSKAYSTVSGQNSNNSVRINNAFMQAVQEDGEWKLYWRTEKDKARKQNRDAVACKTLKARDLWEQIANAAWSCADPGVQFDTTINEWHTCPRDGKINASNPCVTGDTRICTSEGWKRIDSLLDAPFEVLGADGAFHRVQPAFATGVKPVYRLRTQSNFSLKLTEEHKVRTRNRGDVPARELQTGDLIELAHLQSEVTFGSLSLDPRLREFLGLLLGDGCVTGTQESATVSMAPGARRVARKVLEDLQAYKKDNAEDGRGARKGSVNKPQKTLRFGTSSRCVVDQLVPLAVLSGPAPPGAREAMAGRGTGVGMHGSCSQYSTRRGAASWSTRLKISRLSM
jgi:ribonucleoside-diphosphate reductase alpha chain